MSALEIRDADSCAWDCVSLGEVMLRLDPEWDRVRNARSFRAWEGGGEYNVSRALSRTFGMRTAVATALVDNEVGKLVGALIRTGGVDGRHIKVGAVRRHRSRRSREAELHREGLRHPSRPLHLRPRVHRRGRVAARRHRLAPDLRGRGRPLVPHLRHHGRPVRPGPGGDAGGDTRSSPARPREEAVNYGATHGALVMTTPGDTSQVDVAEVEAAMYSKTARAVR